MSEQYVFGYGSLINADSLKKTLPGHSGTAIPVRVQDLCRGWTFPIEEARLTVLGAKVQAGAECSGVLIPVSPADVNRLDEREEGYTRVRLETWDVHSQH